MSPTLSTRYVYACLLLALALRDQHWWNTAAVHGNQTSILQHGRCTTAHPSIAAVQGYTYVCHAAILLKIGYFMVHLVVLVVSGVRVFRARP
jgi:hypothetical protein